MRVVYIIILLYLLLPLAGLYTVSDVVLNVYYLSIQTVYDLRLAYPFYLGCFAFSFFLSQYFRSGSRFVQEEIRLTQGQLTNLGRFITLFLIVAALIVFALVGQDILTGKTHRGAVRVSFGGFGFLYKTFVQFWVPTALALSGILYRIGRTQGIRYGFPIVHLLLTLGTLAMMGYKSGIIVGLLPFLFIVIPLLSWGVQALIGAALTGALIYYSAIIMDAQSLTAAAQYLFIRATEGTAWGLIASWEIFETPHPSSWLSLMPIFGSRLTAMMMDIPRDSIEYLMLGSGQYVTYLVHPDPSVVLAGETNLTITLAGEGVYLFGRSGFWFVAIPVGFITGLMCNALRTSINSNKIITAPLMSIAVTNILLPLLNSGGIVSLFSAFNIFYVLMTFLFLKVLYMAFLTPPRNIRSWQHS
ncbi:hypothetical protein [Pseudooceanicola onchidii]|uniref:hypothetical protein n=1 Tax=Pseudooceanicola onchidii TaxID=2562279 RepID=UPI0010AB1757|nr:hypothetical protein [Pseudooceanicola onchidii]